MEISAIDSAKEMVSMLLLPEQNLCIGTPNCVPIRLQNVYPPGKMLYFHKKNFVYYDFQHYMAAGAQIKNCWDQFFRFPYLYCSWHNSCGKHTFKLIRQGVKIADLGSWSLAMELFFNDFSPLPEKKE